MTPIPRAAMPVVRVLRRDVKRPKDLPVARQSALRWGACCPMGLHKGSFVVCPVDSYNFAGGAADQDSVDAFFRWWDSLPASDARAAVDAVWGKRRKA